LQVNTSGGFPSNGQLINSPGALIDIQADVSIDSYNGGGTSLIINQGTVRKSGGTGTSIINPNVNNFGLVDIQSGTVDINSGGTGNGVFEADAGATLQFTTGNGYTANAGAQFLGSGTNLLTSGVFTVSGNILSSNAVLAGANLTGTGGIISGVVTWTGGTIASGNTLTIATNGLLILAGNNGGDYPLAGAFTNNGTLRLVSGNLQVNTSGGFPSNGQLMNSPGALIDIRADVSIDSYNGGGTSLIINQGTIRKSSGTGTSIINPNLNNLGLVDIQSGTVDINSGGNGNGVFEADTGATLQFTTGNGYTANAGAQFLGSGTNLLTSGIFTIPGNILSSNLVLAGANIRNSTGSISGILTWTGGAISFGSILNLATNGTMVLAGNNGSDYYLSGLTNAGTLRLVSGNLQIGVCGADIGTVVNLPGALVDFVSDVSIDNGCATALLVNQGTVRKSSGTGTSIINPNVNNFGLIDVQSGTMDINSGGSGNGVFEADTGATLQFTTGNGYTANAGAQFLGSGTNILTSGIFTIPGNILSSNLVLAGANIRYSTGSISGVLTWTGGAISFGSILNIATNGTLVLAGNNGSDYYVSGLTNAGTLRLISGNLQIGLCGADIGTVVNLPGALVDFVSDVSIDNGCATALLVNQGSVRKSGGTGTSTINPNLDNFSLLDVQSGTVSLNGGNYFQIGGGLNFGISGSTNFGRIIISGNAKLAGTPSANLINGFFPQTNQSFQVMTFGSESGGFSDTSGLFVGGGLFLKPVLAATTLTLTTVSNSPTTIAITSPTNGATFNLPGAIPITASVSHTNGTIVKVEFFAGGTKLGQATSAPYTILWTNAAGGDYALTARATDDQGGTTTSLPVDIMVSANCDPLPSGIVDWWQGESNVDIIGGNNGTLLGAATFVPGEVGQAFSFNGATGYISTPSSPNYPAGNTPRTVEMWFKAPLSGINNSGSYNTVFNYGTNQTREAFGIDLHGLTSSGTIQLLAWTYFDDVNFDSGVQPGNWMHVAVTYDGNVTLSAYVNGALVATHTLSAPLNTPNPSAVTIGRQEVDPNQGFYYFQGLIDEVSLYNRALSPAEIAAIYTAGVSGKCVPCLHIAAPTNIVVSSCTATQLFYNPTLTIACCTGTNVLCSPPSGTLFAPGTVTNVQCIATDSCGNSNAASFTVMVLPQDVVPIFSTGLDTNGAPLPSGTVDEHYSLVQPGNGVAPTYLYYNGAYLSDTTRSKWVAPAPDGSGGNWVAQQSFNVPFASGLVVTGQCAADNGVGIYIDSTNNNAVAISTSFTSWQPFTITNLVPGMHTLICLVTNAGGPTALRVELGGYSFCPTNCLQVQAPADIVVPSCTATQLFYAPVVADNCCSNWNVSCVPPSGSFFNPGTVTTVQCTATDSCGNSNSSSFNVTVVCSNAPSITGEPLNVTVVSNSAANFSVSAIGQSPLSYQWLLDGSPLANNGRISGAQNSSMSVQAARPTDAGNYQVIVSNSFGSVTSLAATLTVLVPPSIVVPPQSVTAGVGGSAMFSVQAAGSQPLTYQWWFGNSSLAGATNATFAIANVQSTNQGQYSVVIANGAGSVTSAPVILNVLAGYCASAQPTQAIYPMGTVVPISVQTFNCSSPTTAVPNQFATVWISSGSFVRSLPATTGPSGSTVVDFTPIATEAGVYQVAAALPGLPIPPAQATFTLVGMSLSTNVVSTQIIPGTPVTNTITLSNLASVDLTGLTAAVVGSAPDVQVQITPPSTLAGGTTGQLVCVLSARHNSTALDRFTIQLTTAQGTTNIIAAIASVVGLAPQLTATPTSLKASMIQGGQTLVSFFAINTGGSATGPISVILSPAPWLSLVTPQPIPSLSPGQSNLIMLALTPATNLALGNYSGGVELSAANASLSIPFTFDCISTAEGALQVTAQDELTYFETNSPNVSNATVTVSDFVTGSNVATSVTGASGIVLFTNLTAAYYNVSVSAPDHGSFNTTVLISGGLTNDLSAFLPLQLVDFTWIVTPSDVPDHYQFTLDETFETQVPFPVVTINPGAVDLCTLQGQTNQISLTITNSGIIAAQSLNLNFGTNANWLFQPLVTSLGDLLPETNMVVPVNIIRLGSSTNVPSQIPAWLNYDVTAVNGTFTRNVPIYIYDANPSDCDSHFNNLTNLPVPITCTECFGGGTGSGGGGPFGPSPVQPPDVTVQTPQSPIVAVKLEIDQTAVIARDGFHATLKLNNNSGAGISNLNVSVTVYDASNNVANSLFGIPAPALTGLNAVDGMGVLANGGSGQAMWTIVPATNAAPLAPTPFSIGGTLSYTFNGEPVTIPLFPVRVTVLPCPIFTVDYFLQHDVYGNDPFTPQIEPSLPFTLGILVRNIGYGNANDFSITSGQPKIIENTNDLIIAFQLIGSQIGTNTSISSLFTLDFGELGPQGIGEGLWFMTSTLEGQFVSFDASFQHLDNFGNTNTSLINSVKTHELNHVVELTVPADDGLPDFLVNDTTNVDAPPNMAYSSDSSIYSVSSVGVTNSTTTNVSSTMVTVIVTNPPAGWGYFEVVDPLGGANPIASVQRSDGTNLLVGPNVWQTPERIHMVPPQPSNLIHIFDYNSTGIYTITYGLPVTAPGATTTAALEITPTSALLTGTVTPNGATTEAFFEWGTTTNYGESTAGTTLDESLFSAQAVEIPAAGLPANTTIHFRIAAVNSAGTTVGPDVAFVTPPLLITQVANQSIADGQTIIISNRVQAATLPVTFSLIASDPAGTSITTNGVLEWTPVCAQGSSTNLITIWATDNSNPPLSNSMTFTVVVGECVQISIGSTAVQVGQTGNVPVTLLSTVGLTNLNFTLVNPSGRFTNWAFAPSNSSIGSATLQLLGSSNVFLNIDTTSGQTLQSPSVLGSVFLTPESGHSAFVPLVGIGLLGTKSDGSTVGNITSQPGRVVVIGPEPLLQAGLSNSTRILILYGNPGTNYQLLYSTNLHSTNWLPGPGALQTNLLQFYSPDPTAPQIYYRAH
jgi:hypothetical protein